MASKRIHSSFTQLTYQQTSVTSLPNRHNHQQCH